MNQVLQNQLSAAIGRIVDDAVRAALADVKRPVHAPVVDAVLLPLPEFGLLKIGDVLEFVRVGKSTWFKWVQEGLAPPPLKIGRNTLWFSRDIRVFIQQQTEQTPAADISRQKKHAVPLLPPRGRGGAAAVVPPSLHQAEAGQKKRSDA